MSLTPDKSNPTHSPRPPDPGVNQGERRPKSRLPFPVILAIAIAGFVLIMVVVGAIGRSSVPDVNGLAPSSSSSSSSSVAVAATA